MCVRRVYGGRAARGPRALRPLVLGLVLVTCTPLRAQLTLYTNATLGPAQDEAPPTPTLANVPPSDFVNDLRLRLMRDNYDYIQRREQSRAENMIKFGSSPTMPTTSPYLTTTTSPHLTTMTNPPLTITTGPKSEDYHYPDRSQILGVSVEPPELQFRGMNNTQLRSRQAAPPPPTPPDGVLYNQPLAYDIPSQQVFNKDLFYYVDDDRLKSGINFRRQNYDDEEEEPKLEKTKENYEELEEDDEDVELPRDMTDPPPPRTHHHRRHHKHMEREDMYRRRIYKRPLRRRPYKYSAKAHRKKKRPVGAIPRGNRLKGHPYIYRHRPRPYLRKRPLVRKRPGLHGRPRRGKGQLLRRHFTTIKLNNEDDEERDPALDAQNEGADDMEDVKDSLSKQYDDVQGGQGDNGEINPSEHKETITKNQSEEDSPEDQQKDPSETNVDGRRSYNGSEQNGTVLDDKTTTYKYKLLRARGSRSRRSGGGDSAPVLQQRGAQGVALVPLVEGARRLPQFRLPRSRRQYMNERSAARAPLTELLPPTSRKMLTY